MWGMLTLPRGNRCRLRFIQPKPPIGGRCWQFNSCNTEYHAGLFFTLQKFTAGNPPRYRGINLPFVTPESLTGRTYFGTVAKLLPKTLAELSAASG
jgi:hypothetical protein